MEVGLIWSFILIGHPCLSGVWLGANLRISTTTTCGLKRLDWYQAMLLTFEMGR